MTAPLRGDDLAYATLDYIRDHPEEWNQRVYFCGSTACFAGRAILLGLDAASRDEKVYDRMGRITGTKPSRTAARELLGWNEAQCDRVFLCFTRDFTMLEQAVKDVLNGDVK